MKQMKHFFSSMLAVMAAAVMLTACDQVADNPTVPAKLTVTETNGVKVTKLTLTSVGTNHVYDLTPYITDADGMSTFSCDQIFIDGGASDLYYDVYAEDAKGNEYAANVYLNMVRGQQNTLEVELKMTKKALTLSDLINVLNSSVDEGAQLVFTLGDGSKVAYVPKNIGAEDNPDYRFDLNDGNTLQYSGSYFNGFEDFKFAKRDWSSYPPVSVPSTIKDGFHINTSTSPQLLCFIFDPRDFLDQDYYVSYFDSDINGWLPGPATEAEKEAFRATCKKSFRVDFKVDEENGDYYLLSSNGGFEVPTITYRKDATSDFDEIKGLRNGDTEEVAISSVIPDDENWDILAAKIPEEVAKFEAGYKYAYDPSITTWDDFIDRFDQWVPFYVDDRIYYSDGTESDQITEYDNHVFKNELGYHSGSLHIQYNFYLQKKNADGTLTLVKRSDAIDPDAEYVFAQVPAPEVD